MNLFTSRSCPFGCIYCSTPFGRQFRARSPENVFEEIRTLVERYDIKYFEIIDDIFNYDLDRAKRILDLLYQEGLPVDLTFPSGLRCDLIDREFLEKLGKFKFAYVGVPVETASPRLQRLIKKNLNLSKVTKTINICSELGIYTRGYFMLGFPTETADEIRMTVDYAVKSRLHTALFFAVIPFKGTKLYDLCLPRLRNRQYRYEDYNYFRSPMNLSDAPDRVLFRAQRWAYPRMALSPSRIYRLLRDFPDYGLIWHSVQSWSEFFRGAGKGHRPGKPVRVPGSFRPGG